MNQITNTIETNDYIVNYSNKMELSNNYDIQIVESINKVTSQNQINIRQSFSFKIKNVSEKPLKTVAIFLTQNESFVGFISANLYRDNTATLIMSGINYTPLPPELDNLRNYLLHEKRQDVAIYVDENYQRQGNGKKLIYILFRYLSDLGITSVKVSGIKDEKALKTYISTGAIQTSDKTAIYPDINQVIGTKEQNKKL